MKLLILSGGIGGAKFLLGAREYLGKTPFPADINSPQSSSESFENTVTAIVNVGDDAWMHGMRIAPDLDSCMYTLGNGIDSIRGWGRQNETFHAQEELAAYKAEPSWFGLGDRDLATHMIRTHMLSAGYPLSQITQALCKRWDPGVRLIPASDDRHETHVIVSLNPADPSEKQAIHFQQWWVKERTNLPTYAFVQVNSSKSTPAPGVLEAINQADLIMLAPSNPVVSVGAILTVPGIRAALRQAKAKIIGYSPIIGGSALRGMAEKCLAVEGYGSTTYEVARYYGPRSQGLLDGWLIDLNDATSAIEIQDTLGIPTRAIPLWMHDTQHSAQMVKAGISFAEELT